MIQKPAPSLRSPRVCLLDFSCFVSLFSLSFLHTLSAAVLSEAHQTSPCSITALLPSLDQHCCPPIPAIDIPASVSRTTTSMTANADGVPKAPVVHEAHEVDTFRMSRFPKSRTNAAARRKRRECPASGRVESTEKLIVTIQIPRRRCSRVGCQQSALCRAPSLESGAPTCRGGSSPGRTERETQRG
ncbi:hypothetical protein VTJ49DRAFT_3486 [Mycothermus thermophilus]|uniref:Uncharacterized protein n=1 Tax=Humicola insolens TaxID=85995 RepID=A0ABR3V7H9_HUMIN